MDNLWSIDCGETSTACDILMTADECIEAAKMAEEDDVSEAWFQERIYSSFDVLTALIRKGLTAAI